MTLTLRIDNFDTLKYGGSASKTLNQKGCSVGRAPGMDWVLPDPGKHVSSHHFNVSFSGGVYYLTDVSTNGTFLQGQPSRLEGTQEIRTGNKYRVGHYYISADLPVQEKTVVASVPQPSTLVAEDPDKTVAAKLVDTSAEPKKDIAPVPSNISKPPMGKPLVQSPLMQSPLSSPPQVTSSRMQSTPQMPATMPRPSPDLSSMPPSRIIQAPTTHSPTSKPAAPPVAKAPGLSLAPANPFMTRAPNPAPKPSGDDLVSTPPFARSALSTPPVVKTPLAQTPLSAPSIQKSSIIAEPPAAKTPAASKSSGDVDPVLAAFCKGAGLSVQDYADVDPVELAKVLGQCIRSATDGIMDVLQEQANIKHSSVGDDSTMRSTAANNPMKFLSETDESIETMFLKPRSGFMNGEDGFKDAMDDIRLHQAAVSAAFPPAIGKLLSGLSPEEIESKTTDQAEAWNAYVALWQEKSDNNRNGMLDLFLKAFADAFGNATR